ncbi:EscU/YscU/HrcU family type III secretion system export apparatus switch protein [Thiobacillus sp.]|jgi:flagellar biosynthetic protein FlhB|uniref:EscU/YscU/HrcU family type III secretion system export apparatus switch protein n=1 Tax=Thiobacillus sp. TaxID=924 RepID=UPI00181D1856|nr:EscU/YscU/HrcU family type III secretion system export apparatus switch protein [Thiobacillus sp.]MBC2731001.1 flagellar biosynthesis protein FlhB [Thiobacillus sp.]MBC2739738.1 EscU/YscU/HrcU family type III secretion system export apparatus switch protein [Thiobacillus sp.]MBC2758733.1 EscU/YscU/HrcU family type III secretion system export apparatus switch protein [Thiobacillus sp.]MBD3811105.1 EscU/YscU/HrcU family type III secretion system export apparatus switch protein [Betaproteobacte
MAEETDLSRTEPASPRRLQLARSAGDVPRSAELTAWAVLLSALGMLGWLAPRLLNALQVLIEVAFIHAAQPLSPVFIQAAWAALWAVLPVLGVIFAAALVAPILLSGWVFAPQAAQADLTRANPFKPFARLFSVESLFDGSLVLLKLALAAAAVGWVLTSGWSGLHSLTRSAMSVALDATAAWVGRGVLMLAAALTLAAAADAGWRWWRYLRRHAMTWQEVLAEARESEVNPEVRARVRGRQQQAGQRVDEVIG